MLEKLSAAVHTAENQMCKLCFFLAKSFANGIALNILLVISAKVSFSVLFLVKEVKISAFKKC